MHRQKAEIVAYGGKQRLPAGDAQKMKTAAFCDLFQHMPQACPFPEQSVPASGGLSEKNEKAVVPDEIILNEGEES